jgi:hypothetical protein
MFYGTARYRYRLAVAVRDGLNNLTRFNPGNAHVYGLSRHGAYVGSGELDSDQTKAEVYEVLPRFGPLGRVMTYVLLV